MSTDESALDRAHYRRLVVLALAVLISVLFLYMVRGFLMPLLLAAIFAGLLRPVYLRLVKALRGRQSLASVLTVLLGLLFVGIPLVVLLGIVVAQAARVSDSAIEWIKVQSLGTQSGQLEAWLVQRIPALEGHIPAGSEIMEKVGEMAGAAGSFLVRGLSSVTTGAAGFFLDAFVMLYAMFFFFIDGPRLIRGLVRFLPLPDLLVLIGTLGGIILFGPAGFIVGPIICALFITIWQIYAATFSDALEDQDRPEAPPPTAAE